MIIAFKNKIVLHRERSGKYSLRFRVTLRGRRPIDFALGFLLADKSDWDNDKQKVKQKNSDAARINRSIADIDSTFLDYMARYEYVEKRVPSQDEIRRELAVILGRYDNKEVQSYNQEDDLFYVYDLYCKQKRQQNQWSGDTAKHYLSLKHHLEAYSPIIKFTEFNDEVMQGFVDYLIANELKNTYISRLLSFLRWFLRWANEQGLYHGNSHNTYRPKLKGSRFEFKEVVYLTIDELQRIEDYKFPPAHVNLEPIRDIFIFCCYTGLRFSDAAKLSVGDVYDDYIEIVTKKTSERIRIELNRHSRAIIDKYRDSNQSGFILPAISNQRTNVRLKEIGRLCQLNEKIKLVYFSGNRRQEEIVEKWRLLTTHCARRTFVITALQLGVPAEVIMKWTGHSDYKSMKPYIEIVDALKAKNMAKFDNI